MILYRVMRTAWAAAANGVRTLMAQLQVPTAGAEPIPGDDVEVIQPLGVRAKPVVRAGTEACVFELANGQRVCILVDKTRDEGAVEPADGEVVVGGLAAPSAVVHLKADGSIEITPAAGKDVVLNGGTKKVARETDAVTASTNFAAWIGNVQTALNSLGSPVTAMSGDLGAVKTGAGAPNVKA